MTYGEFFALIGETGLSPERAAERLGVSNMTLRRWRSRPPGAALSAVHARAFKPVFAGWMADGTIRANAKAALPLARGRENSFMELLKSMGFPSDALTSGPGDESALLHGLSNIGDDPARRRHVERAAKKITAFGAIGREWKIRVTALLGVIRSNDLLSSEKLVAYGALSYLLMPMDLIPDALPAVGLLDDFALLGIAFWFYRKRFPQAIRAQKIP